MPARRWINTDVDGAGASTAPEPGEMFRLIPTGDAPEAGGDAPGKAIPSCDMGRTRKDGPQPVSAVPLLSGKGKAQRLR